MRSQRSPFCPPNAQQAAGSKGLFLYNFNKIKFFWKKVSKIASLKRINY